MVGQPRRELEREHAHGYKLEEVVADLVDNSIDANADNIWVIFAEETYTNKVPQEKKYKTKDSFFLIVIDDGSGIDEEGINSVMDFGAPRVYDELELGKFGVGMKSSSLSQAKEITLLSKVAGGNIELRRLSSEIVYDDDEWVLIPELEDHMNTDAISIAKRELAELKVVRIVLEDMHKLDNRIGTENKLLTWTRKWFTYGTILTLFRAVHQRVTLRRNDGSTVERQVNIFLNGNDHINRIPLLDPFCVESRWNRDRDSQT